MGFGMARTMISNALPRAYCSGSRFAAATPRFRIRYRASLPRKPGPRTEKSPIARYASSAPPPNRQERRSGCLGKRRFPTLYASRFFPRKSKVRLKSMLRITRRFGPNL